MEINRLGITRTVLLTKNYAIKFPSLRHRCRFTLYGLKSNIRETRIWREKKDPNLCPVIFSCYLFLVMPKVELTNQVLKGIIEDEKSENFGIYKGNLVAIDYGEVT